MDHPRRLKSIVTRARYAALLPRTTIRWARGWDQTFRLSPTQDDPYRLQQSNGGRQWFEAKATWNLDRLLFVNEELPVERMRSDWNKKRAQLAGRVLELLFTWEKMRLASHDQTLSDHEQLEARITQSLAEMQLDIITGGWFGRWLDGGTAKTLR